MSGILYLENTNLYSLKLNLINNKNTKGISIKYPLILAAIKVVIIKTIDKKNILLFKF